MTPEAESQIYDVFIIGGGVNGCGIARDAAGRGMRVALAEMGDLGGATSSASTKLFHGGLRYLEYLEIRLVREALIERENLLRAMPHISWPLRFVLPLSKDMRFDSDTPVSRILARIAPWMAGRRPDWLIRLGLLLYDRLGGREVLPGTRRLDLKTHPAGKALQDRFATAFEYSDCWIEDSRLVVLNAVDARNRGATIWTRTRVTSARRDGDAWHVQIRDTRTGATMTVTSRALVNAAGPWVGDVLTGILGQNSRESVRLVRGSHIVTRKLFDHDQPYFFQGRDGRIIFAIPYEAEFTLIGTTDAAHPDTTTQPECTDEEADYLCKFASEYFKVPVTQEDIVWRYSGVRPLYDDGVKSATAATRDYVLSLDQTGAPLLSVFGGKITTYRKLSEAALSRLETAMALPGPAWTKGAALPGGDFPVDGAGDLVDRLQADYPFLDAAQSQRLIRAYGTLSWKLLGHASDAQDLGQAFGAGLTEAELTWLRDKEFAETAEDVVWRRTKLGLKLTKAETAAIEDWMQAGSRDAA